MKKEYIIRAMADRIKKLNDESNKQRLAGKPLTADKLDFAVKEIQALLEFASE